MKLNTRLVIESIIVSIILMLVYLGWRIVKGYILTRNYVPDIVNNYESVDILQSDVSFGLVNNDGWVIVLISVILLSVFYYGIRRWLTRRNP